MRLPRNRRRALMAGVAVLLVVVPALAWRAASLRASTSAYWYGLLSSGARQTTRMVDGWVAERRSDVRALTRDARAELAHPDPDADAIRHLSADLEAAVSGGRLSAGWTVDAGGAVLAAAGHLLPSPQELAALRATAADGRARVVGPVRTADGELAVSFVEAVRGDGDPGARLGATAVRANLEVTLFRTLPWTMLPSRTGRSRLLARSGGDLGVASARERQPGTDASYWHRIPLRQAPPSMRAALGGRDTAGVASDLDGAEVIFAASTIPSTGWVVLRTIHRDEALASLWRELWIETLLALLLMATLALSVAVGSRHGRGRELARVAESRARLAEAQEIAHLGSWEWDPAAGVVHWSDELFRIHGLAPEREPVDAARARGFIHPDDRARMDDVFDTALRLGHAYVAEHRLVCADGEIRHVQGRGRPGGAGMVGTVQDVTGAWTAQARLELARQQQSALIDNIPDIAFLKDLDSRYLAVNDAAARAAGTRKEEMVGKTDLDLFPRHVAEANRAEDLALFARGEPVRMEETFSLPDGETRWIEVIKTPVRDPAGACVGVAGIARDITERRQSQEALAESEERLTLALAGGRLALWDCWMPTGRVHCSAEWEALLGYAAGELGDDYAWWEARVHPDDVPALHAAVRRHLRGEHPEVEVVFRIRTSAGKWVWLHARARATARDEGGRVLRVTGTGTDITEQKALEDQLRQSQKMEAVGHLAGGVAHDFNNLLTVIKTASDLLIDSFDPDDARLPDAVAVNHAADRAADLTRQLLAFSRGQVLQPQVTDARAVIASIEQMLQRLLGENVKVAVAQAPDVGRVRVDPGQMHQVLMNLAVNARDAMPEGGTLTLTSANRALSAAEAQRLQGPEPVQAGDYVVLTVADTGCGMSRETLARAFEPFFTTKPVGKGTGLGLSTAYGIVRQSGGYLAADVTPGRGSTFSIFLPRDRTPEAQVAPPAPAEQAAARAPIAETVLLAEDEASVRNLVRRVLLSHGYHVLAAASGPEALELAARHDGPIPLLLTDVVMPGMSGPVLAEKLTAARADTRVLFMSGYADDHLPSLGPDRDLLLKPFAPGELLQRTRAALDEGDRRTGQVPSA